MIFSDRREAGERLAQRLLHLSDRDPVILALPRGGVPIGLEIAQALSAPLDLLLVRKIGAPGQPELAIGAVVDGERLDFVVNEDIVHALGLSEDFIKERAVAQVAEIERRRSLYLGDRDRVRVRGRTIIVADDGIATGATVRAALRGIRQRDPGHLVLAVPVAPAAVIDDLREEVDEVVCLETPYPFGAIGWFYRDFDQVSDDEVRAMMDQAGTEHESAISPRDG
ncbi:MAG: phosphoribosyltransferase [Thermoleophilia bacterium]|nr:phosphoribosyltransferase [Thermoleophilia bacterium]